MRWRKEIMTLSMFSIDIDSQDLFLALKTFYNCAYISDKVLIRKSANKGYHIKAFIYGELSRDKEKHLRELFGDDKNRILMDFNPQLDHKPHQVMWTWKNGKRAGKWLDNPLDLPIPFKSSRIPRRKRKL